MKMSSSFVTILLPRIRALLNGNVCKGLMVLHRSQMIPHILRFWVASVNKFNTNNLALFEFWKLSGIPLSSLHDILAFSRTQSELLGEMSNFKRKRIFFFFLTWSTESVYWKDPILMLATHTDEVDYEERNCLVH